MAAFPTLLARRWPLILTLSLALAMGVGVLCRGYWTPDEPREADIAWRMSWQADKAVPLLAGEAFCEKPPLTYWIAGAAIDLVNDEPWATRLPNLVYALISALAVGALGRRCSGRIAAWAAAAAITTFLLSYQVAIWLATDAPLLASTAVALLGLHIGFYGGHGSGRSSERGGTRRADRLRGYTLMHAGLAMGFLSKSAAGWMVPVLTLVTLVVWERRWRELLRWELYAGVALQAVLIFGWVGTVYAGPDGVARLKVFFWNNLAGRFAAVQAPEELQYAAAHRNSPGKYLIELPAYLWPWTLLVIAAARRAWIQLRAQGRAQQSDGDGQTLRFSIATFVPTLGVLSLAATARNIYLAPALPGLALLLGWWVTQLPIARDRWDDRAIRATAGLLGLAWVVMSVALLLVGHDDWHVMPSRPTYLTVAVLGLAVSGTLMAVAGRAQRRGAAPHALLALLLAYCALLIGPASQLYGRIDTWQNLAAIGRAIGEDSAGKPLILWTADETTRAFVDMYAQRSVTFIPPPVSAAALQRLRERLEEAPDSVVVAQLPSRRDSPTLRELQRRLGRRVDTPPSADDGTPDWAAAAGLTTIRRYALPNGRRYILLETGSATKSR